MIKVSKTRSETEEKKIKNDADTVVYEEMPTLSEMPLVMSELQTMAFRQRRSLYSYDEGEKFSNLLNKIFQKARNSYQQRTYR